MVCSPSNESSCQASCWQLDHDPCCSSTAYDANKCRQHTNEIGNSAASTSGNHNVCTLRLWTHGQLHITGRPLSSALSPSPALMLLLAMLIILTPCTMAKRHAAQSGPTWRTNENDAELEDLMSCINEGFTFKRTNWNDSIEFDTPANLKVEKVWWSRKPPRFNFTVITQLSTDRMPALFNQCTTYTGPLAAAVYLPLVQLADPVDFHGVPIPISPEDRELRTRQLARENSVRLQHEVERLQDMYKEIEANPSMCQLDLMLLWEAFDSKEAALLYPVNTLRNFARMQVRSSLVSAIDVDMMISASLSEEMTQGDRFKRIEEYVMQRHAVVLPAFEPVRQGPFGRAIADEVARAPKARLQAMFRSRPPALLQFKFKVFSRGHTPTNYTHWFSTSEAYQVQYRRMYEPWFITHRSMMPWFDVRFRGYGLNKIAFVASMNFYQHTFLVHPGAWLVHRPHEDTQVRKMVAREASNVNSLGMKLSKSALYYKVTQLFGEAKRGMIRGTYSPKLDERMVRCWSKMPWLGPLKNMTGSPVSPQIFI